MKILQSLHLDFTGLIIFLFFAFIFFLIVREIVTWYWKINKIVKLLEKIEQNTSSKFNPEPEIAEKDTESAPEQKSVTETNKNQLSRSVFDK